VQALNHVTITIRLGIYAFDSKHPSVGRRRLYLKCP
jgi:hypothetical protein